MKQTHNALSMLLKAYRSVFKAAYMKGIASAVILTAGLAAGAANADAGSISGSSANSWDAIKEANKGVVSGSATISKEGVTGYYDLKVTDKGNSLTVSGDKVYLQIKNNLTVGKSGSLTVSGGAQIAGYNKTDGNDTHADDATGKLISEGTVEVKGQVQMNSVSLRSGSTTTVTGTGTYTKWDDNVNFGAGLGKNGSFSIDKGAKVEVTSGGIIYANQGSPLNISGELSLDESIIRGCDNVSYSDSKYVYDEEAQNAVINLNSSAVVTAKSGSTSSYIVGPKINIDGAKINVESGATLTFNGDFIKKGSGAASADNWSSDIQMEDGTVSIASGGNLTIGAAKDIGTSESSDGEEYKGLTVFNVNGGKIENAGTITVKGTLNVDSAAKLVASGADSAVKVIDSKGVLGISSDALLGYLLDSDDDGDDQAAKVSLSGGATLDLTSSKSAVELGSVAENGYVFGSGAGQIEVVSGASTTGAGKYDGIIKGNVLTVSNPLQVETEGGYAIGKLKIEASDLTIGDGSKQTTALTKLSQFTSGGQITFKSTGDVMLDAGTSASDTDGSTFTIDSNLYLENSKAEAANINKNGDNLKIVLGNDKTFGIAGNYVVDKDITVVSSSGTSSLGMTIGLTEENKTFEGNSTLTINGKLINGSSDNAYINLQSKGKDGENTYTSTLDLTNTTFENAQNATGVLNIFAQGANNKVVIDETINDILADTGSSGFRFAIGSGSELNINGDLEADFGAIVSAKTDGSANKIALLEGSVVKANAAELTTETETENLNLYQGTLSVADLTVSNLAKVTQASSDEKTIPDEVTMVSGSYNVSNSVTSENKVVTVGQDATLVSGYFYV